jgi:hypothetical protein
VVISDLKATYEGGSAQIIKALEDLKNEANRSAITLEPVGFNNDDIYHILRKRLLETLPNQEEIQTVAKAYAQAVKDAKQMDITNASPEKFASQLVESYPFHFAIRDLYARFRENPGFQQTRGLIRLMRTVVARIYDPEVNKAENLALIHVHDLDLNDADTRSEITQINPTLENAISHDIAASGVAIAENDDLDYKNRILFLSGARGSLDALLDTAAELKAISYILTEMKAQKIAENDPQFASAQDMEEKIRFRLLSAVRETFTVLSYPTDQLRNADFIMNFTDNNYNGEKQIRDTLKAKGKFTEDITSDTFRKKCEQRLFTQKAMLWTEVKKRAALDTRWQWHRLDALDNLKNDLISKDQWRENSGYVEKPPFPKPDTEIYWRQVQRNGETGEVTLALTAVHGDTIYYEIGATATTASQKVTDFNNFVTNELEISFLCVDKLRRS